MFQPLRVLMAGWTTPNGRRYTYVWHRPPRGKADWRRRPLAKNQRVRKTNPHPPSQRSSLPSLHESRVTRKQRSFLCAFTLTFIRNNFTTARLFRLPCSCCLKCFKALQAHTFSNSVRFRCMLPTIIESFLLIGLKASKWLGFRRLFWRY